MLRQVLRFPRVSGLGRYGLLGAVALVGSGATMAHADLAPRRLTASVNYGAFANVFERNSAYTTGTSGTSEIFLDYATLYGGTPPIAAFHGTGAAAASYGLVGSTVEVILHDFSTYTYSTNTVGASVAEFWDIVTVDQAPATGTVNFTVQLSGAAASSAYDVIRPYVLYNLGWYDGVSGGSLLNLHSGSLGYYPTGTFVSASVPYTLGVPFNLTAQIQTFLDIVAPRPYEDPGPIVAGVYYGNTAAITGVQVFDAAGHLVPGATVTGAGGNSYPVPEPASIGLLGLVLCCVPRRP